MRAPCCLTAKLSCLQLINDGFINSEQRNSAEEANNSVLSGKSYCPLGGQVSEEGRGQDSGLRSGVFVAPCPTWMPKFTQLEKGDGTGGRICCLISAVLL